MEAGGRIRVHVTGAPRSGTTLMHELMVAGFDLDSGNRHEYSLLRMAPPGIERFCSKKPLSEWPHLVLAADPRLRVISMVRDPRDVVVSRHRQYPRVYWANLRQWHEAYADIRRLKGHPRFMLVRYEDLVSDPDAVQDRIAGWLTLLERRAAFSDFARVAQPHANAVRALSGVREIDASSIGAWRQAPERVLGQMVLHGDLTPALVDLGYEPDAGWRGALEGIEPDLTRGYWPDHLRLRLRTRLKQRRELCTHLLRLLAGRLRGG